MRIVLDTNVLISAVGWGGIPEQVLAAGLSGRFQLCTSSTLLVELERVLAYPTVARAVERRNFLGAEIARMYRQSAMVIETTALLRPVSRDPDDDHVLACALSARADYLVSGDDDLLSLAVFEGIEIVNATTIPTMINRRA